MAGVRTVRKLSLPSQTVDIDTARLHNTHLVSVPVASYRDAVPRLIIGVDNYRLTRPTRTVEGAVHQLVATKTRLGWTVCGRCSESSSFSFHVCECRETEARVDRILAKCYDIDDYGAKRPQKMMSKNDERALEMLQSNTELRGDRYATRLLWRDASATLRKSRNMAMSRMECLERRLKPDTDLARKLNEIIESYIAKRYVRKLTVAELEVKHPRTWYLPVFPVTNPNRPAKVRLVWDAAAEVGGVSLNKCLLTGPDLVTPLPAVLYRFREYKIALAADITEMFHQIIIDEEDVQSQRFLWRWGDVKRTPEEFVMTNICRETIKKTRVVRLQNFSVDHSK